MGRPRSSASNGRLRLRSSQKKTAPLTTLANYISGGRSVRILVTGANGQVGRSMLDLDGQEPGTKSSDLTRQQFDLTSSPKSVIGSLTGSSPMRS